MTGLVLRDYQEEALVAIDLNLERGFDRQMLVFPTGAGKTVTFGMGMSRRHARNPRGLPSLVIAHRDELISQAVDKLCEIDPDLEFSIGVVKGKKNQIDRPFVVASIQTLARENRLRQVPREWHTIVVDEAHHAASDSYTKVLNYLQAELYLGVTATPDRTDSRRLDKVFPKVAMEVSIDELIQRGYLVAPRGKRIGIEVDLGSVKQRGGDFQDGALGEALEAANAPTEILSAYLEHGENRKGLIFCPTVSMAHHTADVLRAAGVAAEALDGTTKSHQRRAILERLRSGQTRLVVNCGVLTEGFDEPSVSLIVVARPTKSRSLYCQIIGRGLRLHPDKTDCLVLDLAGASDEMSIQTLPAFFDLKDEENVKDAIERRSRQAGKGRDDAERDSRTSTPQPARGGTRIRDVGFFPRERFHWIHVNGGYVLDLGEGKQLVLRAVDDEESAWQVLLVNQRTDTFNLRGQHRRIEFGQGIAEEIVREEGLLKIVDRHAGWRKGPVTSAQKRKLARLGYSTKPTSAGEASNMIAKAEALETLRRIRNAPGVHQQITERRTREMAAA
ncbi:MAG: DEAD/DEAH box helicase [Solirubrobacterales bacterium]|nr:DEAD/DEAH box helicase [Solirubrobacterales bacterium]